MNTFQILALTVFAFLLAGGLLAVVKRRIRRRDALLWSTIWIGAAIATAFPQTTSVLAEALGIGRGADLVSYLGVLGMLAGFWIVFGRFREQDRRLTLLVRRLALAEADDRQSTSAKEEREPLES